MKHERNRADARRDEDSGLAEYLAEVKSRTGDGAPIKVPPKHTPGDASDMVDRGTKLAARYQRGVMGKSKGPEDLEIARSRRRQQRERSEELLLRIANDLRQTDAVLDERDPTRVEVRETQHDKGAIKKILRDTRVHKRIQSALERRRENWAARHEGEIAETPSKPEGKGR